MHIFDNKKLNSVGDDKFALSSSWSERHFRNPVSCAKMRDGLYNVLRHYYSGKSGNSMWTSFKAQKDRLTRMGLRIVLFRAVVGLQMNIVERKTWPIA